jgi:hypothetical protein
LKVFDIPLLYASLYWKVAVIVGFYQGIRGILIQKHIVDRSEWELTAKICIKFEQTDRGMPFGKASRRTFKRMGTVLSYRSRNSLR